MTDRQQITLAILAGGEGSRMGMPKGLLQIGGRPILAALLDALAWPGPTMLVTAPSRQQPPGHERFDREVVDPVDGGGPLRGVLTALENLDSSSVIIMTVDMPLVGRTQCEFLREALEKNPSAMGIMLRRKNDDGAPQIEPFPCALRAEARPIIARRVAESRRAVHGLLEEAGFVAIEAPAEWASSIWTNLNTPDDVRRFGTGSV